MLKKDASRSIPKRTRPTRMVGSVKVRFQPGPWVWVCEGCGHTQQHVAGFIDHRCPPPRTEGAPTHAAAS